MLYLFSRQRRPGEICHNSVSVPSPSCRSWISDFSQPTELLMGRVSPSCCDASRGLFTRSILSHSRACSQRGKRRSGHIIQESQHERHFMFKVVMRRYMRAHESLLFNTLKCQSALFFSRNQEMIGDEIRLERH